MTRLIDADYFFRTFPELAIEPYINAPTIEERPQGEWIYNDLGYLICSNCGYDCLYDEEGSYIRGSYCYNCGADMRGDDNVR